MTVSLRLIDYAWNGANYVVGSTLTFDPSPKSISKSAEVQWRIMHSGRRKLKKAKFRVRETTTWTVQGSCQGSYDQDALANQIEFYARKNSKFKVIIDASTPQSFLCPDPAGANGHTWEIVFVVIKNVKFTQTEGRIGWLDYTVELERCNCELITHNPVFTDPWKCSCST
jgi:hypothetical protein